MGGSDPDGDGVADEPRKAKSGMDLLESDPGEICRPRHRLESTAAKSSLRRLARGAPGVALRMGGGLDDRVRMMRPTMRLTDRAARVARPLHALNKRSLSLPRGGSTPPMPAAPGTDSDMVLLCIAI
ncbi:hypothetical protein CAL28_23815 [Bordetella genomosp. 11]|uniref:Uncharacterized protein n=1 Tax=Bordetella genomosp. 11 TaxID=1416808 RepID=A0A261UK19_9BORD|nr:hypothetical protein CAL28_23815 [Bordetella genomosp. 11]